jgi:hypothetical protein
MPVLSQTKPPANLTPKKFSDTIAKGRCVTFMSDGNTAKDFAEFGITPSNMCSCVQEEMNYLVSDPLALRLMTAIAKQNSNIKITEEEEKVATEWNGLFSSSFKACMYKLRRNN